MTPEALVALILNSALQIAQLAFPGAGAAQLAAIAAQFVVEQVRILRSHGIAISDADLARWTANAEERARILAGQSVPLPPQTIIGDLET